MPQVRCGWGYHIKNIKNWPVEVLVVAMPPHLEHEKHMAKKGKMTQAIQKPKQEVTVLSCIGSETWKGEVAKVLPQYIGVDVMLRVARSVASDPKFARCSPQSFLIALLKCARAGLPPDGRLAYLIPFGTEVQAIFGWMGYVAAAARNNIMVTPKLVFAADHLEVLEDDGTGKTQVIHKMDITKPRGEIIAVYSRAVIGHYVDYEFMTTEEVEYIRKTFSRAKDSDAWKLSWGEMAKKTVIRRHSKRWDIAPEVASALNEDDDSIIPAVATAPSKPIFSSPKQVEDAPSDPAPAPEKLENLVPKLRELCKSAKIREGVILEYVFEAGIVPEMYKTLDSLNEDSPATTHRLVADWSELAKKLPRES